MKTADLTRAQLDYWVAKALADGDAVAAARYGRPVVFKHLCMVGHGMGQDEFERTFAGAPDHTFREMIFSPSSNPVDCERIIEREGISRVRVVNRPPESWWISAHPTRPDVEFHGPTAKVAAMRAFVASKFGDEVQDAP